MLLYSDNLKESSTLRINSIANQKKNNGEKVYNFSVGEPVIENHALIVEGVCNALKRNRTQYPPVAGINELLRLCADWMNTNYNCSYNSQETMVTCGGKYGIFLALQALLDVGDEVVIISPYWVSYPEMIKIFHGIPRVYTTKEESDWRVDAMELQKLINKKTKAIIINNASNPTGHIFSKQELVDILEMAHDQSIFVISDEVYSGLVYEYNQFISAGSFAEFKDKVIIIQSCSKNFGMTGWRVGMIFGPQEIVKCLAVIQSQSITNTSIVSQWAAITAIQNADTITGEVRKIVQGRRDVFVRVFNELFSEKIKAPQSSLYCFVSLKKMGVFGKNADEFSADLIEQANIALTSGGGFGDDNYVRFSFGISEAEIIDGLRVLKNFTENKKF
ncbi:MAG: aminotransferase class I/II-fold pyridoxal phosphate-dependent enzyme [Candidatus Magasanikbacteria bacterium]|jgi:aspartate/methionine/tyrosine aminotransferase